MSAEKPFDFANTPGKLPKQVVPTDYSIRIVPNIDKLTFTGTETVKLSVRAPVHELVLNALEIEVTAAAVDDKASPKSAIKIDKKNELLTIALPSELPRGIIRSRSVSPERSTNKARDFITRAIRSKARG